MVDPDPFLLWPKSAATSSKDCAMILRDSSGAEKSICSICVFSFEMVD